MTRPNGHLSTFMLSLLIVLILGCSDGGLEVVDPIGEILSQHTNLIINIPYIIEYAQIHIIK